LTKSGTTRACAFKPDLEFTNSREPHLSYSRANEGILSRDLIEGELPRSRSPSNGIEPCLAHPRKRFHGRVYGPRADPYRTGHGRPLESPANSSTRDPRFATRSMGVVDTSPLHPAEGWRRGVRTSRRAAPIASNGPGLGAQHTAAPLDMHRTQTSVDMYAWHRRGWLKHCRCKLKPTPNTLTNTVKNPCRSTHALVRLRGLHPRVR
jgi:hypothetical protein